MCIKTHAQIELRHTHYNFALRPNSDQLHFCVLLICLNWPRGGDNAGLLGKHTLLIHYFVTSTAYSYCFSRYHGLLQIKPHVYNVQEEISLLLPNFTFILCFSRATSILLSTLLQISMASTLLLEPLKWKAMEMLLAPF